MKKFLDGQKRADCSISSRRARQLAEKAHRTGSISTAFEREMTKFSHQLRSRISHNFSLSLLINFQ
jgi:hypothetical protein